MTTSKSNFLHSLSLFDWEKALKYLSNWIQQSFLKAVQAYRNNFKRLFATRRFLANT